jgi:RNA polymerase sigma factor (sigma-70 family)
MSGQSLTCARARSNGEPRLGNLRKTRSAMLASCIVVKTASNITARRATMDKGQPSSALRQLRALFADGTATGLSDRELLERYAAKRAESAEAATAAEAAFTALVDRHGAMVWGVCRRVLGDVHLTEDAFQATFLVLIRKAGSVRVDGSLGRWLYGIARRVALRARTQAGRRDPRIGQVEPPSLDDPVGEVELLDLRSTVGEELDRLPAKYRCPIELCHLQGMTYEQAARQLNWPVATIKSRLTQGRLRLRSRLVRRGLAPSAVAAAMATGLTGDAQAAAPLSLVQSTARAAATHGAGGFPAGVTDLTEGVLKMMIWHKLRLIAAGAVVALGLTARALPQQPAPGGAPATRPPQTAVHPAEKPNETRSGDRRWVRSLPSGAIIEVIGVSPYPTGPKTWWRPDGTPLDRAPCDPLEPGISGDNAVLMVVVARLARLPDGASQEWSINEAKGAHWARAMRDGKFIPDVYAMTVLMPVEAGTCTVHFKVAAGPWDPIVKWGKNPGAVGNKNGPSYIFGIPIATRNGTALSVTHNIQDKPVRLVAIGRDDKEVPAKISSGGGVDRFQQLVVEFNLPPNQIQGFQLQTRPFEEVEIPRIALKPR